MENNTNRKLQCIDVNPRLCLQNSESIRNEFNDLILELWRCFDSEFGSEQCTKKKMFSNNKYIGIFFYCNLRTIPIIPIHTFWDRWSSINWKTHFILCAPTIKLKLLMYFQIRVNFSCYWIFHCDLYENANLLNHQIDEIEVHIWWFSYG